MMSISKMVNCHIKVQKIREQNSRREAIIDYKVDVETSLHLTVTKNNECLPSETYINKNSNCQYMSNSANLRLRSVCSFLAMTNGDISEAYNGLIEKKWLSSSLVSFISLEK